MRWPQLKIKNQKTTVFLVCLGISAFFWLLIKLSKEYEITVNLPVEYSNFPKNKILVNKPDSVLLLKLSDNGFDLIPYGLFGALNHIEMDVQNMEMKKKNSGRSVYYIRTDLLSERINKIISSDNYVSVIRPDSLVLKMEDLKQKKMKVVADAQVELSQQFQLKKEIYCEPDSIILYGSKKQLSAIDRVATEKLEFSDLNSSQVETVPLLIPDFLNSKIKEVKVHIDVEKFTESNIHIPLKMHFESKNNFKIFPANLHIKYAVSFEKYKEVEIDDFKIEILKDTNTDGRLNIRLVSYPSFVRVIDYSPKMAEYIILK